MVIETGNEKKPITGVIKPVTTVGNWGLVPEDSSDHLEQALQKHPTAH